MDVEAFGIPAEVGGARRGERDDPEDVVFQHQVGDRREDVLIRLAVPAVVAPAQSPAVPAVVAPPQDLVAPAVVAPAPSPVAPAPSLAAPARVREGEDRGEAIQEGEAAGTGAGTTITGTAIDTTLGGTTGDGGEGRLSLA